MAMELQEEYSELIRRKGAIMFVGSNNRQQFNNMGREHFDYLLYHKLKPHHVVFDVGCGALRTGQYIIPYLEEGNYYGLDRMPELIEFGLNEVLDAETVFEKKPVFSVNENFNCNFIKKPIDFAWCQSLISHLSTEDIELCLTNIRKKLSPFGRIYFTYFPLEGLSKQESDEQESHSKKDLFYSEQYMDLIVAKCGLKKVYNGVVGHPRGQWMYICKA